MHHSGQNTIHRHRDYNSNNINHYKIYIHIDDSQDNNNNAIYFTTFYYSIIINSLYHIVLNSFYGLFY